MAELDSAVKYVGDNVGALFRHLIPGALILGAAKVAQPSWFASLDVTKGHLLIILSVLAVAIGNAWFVIHRYFIQQVVDLLFWFFKAHGGPQRREGTSYYASVSDHVWRFFSSNNTHESFRRHLQFRTSAVVLLYVNAEIFIFSSLLASTDSCINSFKWCIFSTGVLLFLAAVWQNYLTRNIEGKLSSNA